MRDGVLDSALVETNRLTTKYTKKRQFRGIERGGDMAGLIYCKRRSSSR